MACREKTLHQSFSVLSGSARCRLSLPDGVHNERFRSIEKKVWPPSAGFLPGEVGPRPGATRLSVLQLGPGLVQQRGDVLLGNLERVLLSLILRLRRRQRAFGLRPIDLILTRKGLSLFDELVVGDIKRHHAPGNLRRNRDRATVGVGVIRGFEIPRRPPVIGAADHKRCEHDDANEINRRPAILLRFVVRLDGGLLFRRLAAVGRIARQWSVGLAAGLDCPAAASPARPVQRT